MSNVCNMLYQSELINESVETACFTVTSVFYVIVKITHDQQHPWGGDYITQIVSKLCCLCVVLFLVEGGGLQIPDSLTTCVDVTIHSSPSNDGWFCDSETVETLRLFR